MVTTPHIKSHGGTKSGHDVVTTPQIISHGGTARSRRGPIPTNTRSRQTHRHTHTHRRTRAIKVSFVLACIKQDRRHVPLASLLNLSIFVNFWTDFQNCGNIFLWVFQKSIAAPLGSRCISRVFYVPDPVTPSPWPGGGGRTVVSREGTVRPSAPVRVQVKYFLLIISWCFEGFLDFHLLLCSLEGRASEFGN